MRRQCVPICAALIVSLFGPRGPANAFDPTYPRLTQRSSIDPGSLVFTNQQAWSGASSINVFSAATLKFQGGIDTGTMALMTVSKDGKTAYSASVYMRRYSHGDTEMIVQIHDVSTLRPLYEIAIPPKMIMSTAYPPLMALSDDERYLFIQNATPATSVSVIDVHARKYLAEIPTPGCAGIFPALKGDRFSMVCADGTFANFSLTRDHMHAVRLNSPPLFDADRDPVYLAGIRARSDLVFITYQGRILRLSDDTTSIRLVDSFEIGRGITGGWAPGGNQVIAYDSKNDVMFVSMRPDSADGTHKLPSKEVWSVALSKQQILHRTPVDGLISLSAARAGPPVLFGIAEGSSVGRKRLLRFETDVASGFRLRLTHDVDNPGSYTYQLANRP